jgi:ADP-heptose:LPS heptosyltransferase
MGTFIRPQTLRELVALDLPIAAPFLRATVPESRYSNYHAETDNNGYYKECDQYLWLLEQRIRGIVEVPVVNCTYLVRADVIPELTYQDATKRHEYVAFSDSARKAGIPQYLDNRQIYGYVGNGDGGHDLTTISNALGTAGTTKRRVLWRRPGAIGDVLMTLSLVKLHKEKHPGDWVIYQAAPSIADLLRPIMLEAGVDEVATTDEQVVCDKRVDIIGYPFHERHQATPMTRHLLEYFSEELGLRGQYAELKLRLPKRTIEPPYVTLHATSGWSMYKNWPLDRWAWVCQELKKRGIRVVQIGGPDEPAVEGVEFNRLGLTFTESLGLLANAALHIGIDSWSNHATNIIWEGRGKVPGIILWGASQLSATGYPQNQNISLGLPCQPCFRDDPKVSRVPRGVCPNPPEQSYEMPLHACMHGISREFVLDVINKQYAEGFGGQPSTTSILIRRQAHSDRTLEGDEGPSSSLLAPVVAISDESENQALPPQEAPPQFTIEQTNP